MPSPLKADPVEISLTGNAPVRLGSANGETIPTLENGNGPEMILGVNNIAGNTPGSLIYTNTTSVGTSNKKGMQFTGVKDGETGAAGFMFADLNSVSAISIADLRMSIALQHIFEADARNGTRYREFLSGTWGVTSPDSRLQIPEYIGGQRIAINVNQVVQTSQTDTNTVS